jgi:radical SAM superfamily enzyme YgiQ (UPF0313 family)
MRALLVYPRYPDTFWSFRHALRFLSKKASYPPLGLLTVAAMLPSDWGKKLVDMNVSTVTDADIEEADYVFVSAMSIQKQSAEEVIRRCNELGVKVVAGGPLFTSALDQFAGVDHFVLNEAEATLPSFLNDLRNGCAKRIYRSSDRPDITASPIPLWGLMDMKHYSSMSIQYSRGCPFNCEFCEIIVLNGRKPRTKDKEQLLAEMEALYSRGWRGGVFLVDDNFIGNKAKLKSEILPGIIKWMKNRKYPFSLFTEVSVNLADDDELLGLMVRAGFDTVFVGIETPNEESLLECGKYQNRGRDLIASVKKIQNYGIQVQGGFIVGFDNDPPSIFERQINLIQNSGIVTAMVSVLNAPPGTRLYNRLKRENRLLPTDMIGDNATTNFIPRMSYQTLVNGYRKIINTIYSPKQYYQRLKAFLKEYSPQHKRWFRPRLHHITGFTKLIWRLGVKETGRRYYWNLFFFTLGHPRKFFTSMTLAAYGFHFRKVVEAYNKSLMAT